MNRNEWLGGRCMRCDALASVGKARVGIQVGEWYRGACVLGGDVVGSDEINMTDRKITFDVMRALSLPCYISPVGDDGSYV